MFTRLIQLKRKLDLLSNQTSPRLTDLNLSCFRPSSTLTQPFSKFISLNIKYKFTLRHYLAFSYLWKLMRYVRLSYSTCPQNIVSICWNSRKLLREDDSDGRSHHVFCVTRSCERLKFSRSVKQAIFFFVKLGSLLVRGCDVMWTRYVFIWMLHMSRKQVNIEVHSFGHDEPISVSRTWENFLAACIWYEIDYAPSQISLN